MHIRWKRRHEHPWKLMAAGSVLAGLMIMVSLMEGWYALAVVALIFLGTMAVQWITIDPPNVGEDDLYGPESKSKSST